MLTVIDVEGIKLVVPEILKRNWPKIPLADFPRFCGAGDGLGEKIVPDYIYKVSVKHCCFIHDITHSILPKTERMFHLSNLLLLINIISTIAHAGGWLMSLRFRRALKYYFAVESDIGYNCFKTSTMDEFYNKMKKVGIEHVK